MEKNELVVVIEKTLREISQNHIKAKKRELPYLVVGIRQNPDEDGKQGHLMPFIDSEQFKALAPMAHELMMLDEDHAWVCLVYPALTTKVPITDSQGRIVRPSESGQAIEVFVARCVNRLTKQEVMISFERIGKTLALKPDAPKVMAEGVDYSFQSADFVGQNAPSTNTVQ